MQSLKQTCLSWGNANGCSKSLPCACPLCWAAGLVKGHLPTTRTAIVALRYCPHVSERAFPLGTQPATWMMAGMKLLRLLNAAVRARLTAIEIVGVLMRIFSFSLVSWLGPASPFLFVWVFNTIDAVLLSWCAILKKDRAYTLLNLFWIGVGIVGIVRAA